MLRWSRLGWQSTPEELAGVFGALPGELDISVCHSRRDGMEGFAYLIVNNDLENALSVELPGEAEIYALAGRDGMRSSVMTLNGADLTAGLRGELPALTGVKASGKLDIAPGSCVFVVV